MTDKLSSKEKLNKENRYYKFKKRKFQFQVR